jgi:hypothetical protein
MDYAFPGPIDEMHSNSFGSKGEDIVDEWRKFKNEGMYYQ